MDNFKVEFMRIISKDQFTARKNALMNHSEICQEKLCSICEYFKAVGKFRYDSGNFARYVQHSLTPQPSSKNKKTKWVVVVVLGF